MARGLSIWRYNRYHVIVEYMNRSTSPTPFCVVVHLFLALKWLLRTCLTALKNPTNRVSKKSDQLENFNSKLRYDIEKLNTADNVRLSQFQSNRAVCIMKVEKMWKEHISLLYTLISELKLPLDGSDLNLEISVQIIIMVIFTHWLLDKNRLLRFHTFI